MSWLDLEDIKVILATSSGLGTWLVEMDLLLKAGISLVSFLYVTKKCLDLYRNKK